MTTKKTFSKISRGVLFPVLLALSLVTSCAQAFDTQTSPISGSADDSALVETEAEKSALPSSPSIDFTEDDLDSTWLEDTAEIISLKGTSVTEDSEGVIVDGSLITITASGTYVFHGTLSDGQILVDTTDKDPVRLVLSGAAITSSKSAAVYIKDAEKVIMILDTDTENSLSDSDLFEYDDEEEEEPNATIFSKSDLTITGSGTLHVQASFRHGINCKDGLKIVSGSIDVTSAKDAIRGKDYIAIQSGSFTIAAGDDALHSDTNLVIDGGTFQIDRSYEGIESAEITINGGTFHVKAEDDGINVAGGLDSTEDASQGVQNPFSSTGINNLFINGGNIFIDADGDGIDANASITMTGGNVIVCGPTNNGNGAIDYAGSFTVTGGTLIAAGSSGMAQAPDENSTQNAVMINAETSHAAGTIIDIQDADENSVLTFAPSKDYTSVVFSSPLFVTGETYTISYGGTSDGQQTDGMYKGGNVTGSIKSESFTISDPVTIIGQVQQGMGGMGKGQDPFGQDSQTGDGEGNPRQEDQMPPDGEGFTPPDEENGMPQPPVRETTSEKESG